MTDKTTLLTPPFTVSYPKVFKKEVNKLSGKEEYSLLAVFEPGTDLTPLKKAMEAACAKKFGEDKSKWPKGIRSPIRKNEEKERIDEKTGKTSLPQGMKPGGFFITMKNEKEKPGVFDRANQPIVDPADFYAGCIAHAVVNLSAYNKGGGAGVSVYLQHVQKIKEGEPLGSRVKPENFFSPLEGAEEEFSGSAGGADASSLFN
jgi:hypothetical protein